MVQRKEPTKLKSKTRQVSKSKLHSFDLDESTITKSKSKETASTDNTKNITMKYLPNYMKPTSSSDARKDKDQLQFYCFLWHDFRQANEGSRVLQPPEAEIIVGDPTKFGNRRRRFEEPEKDGRTEASRPKIKEPEKDGETEASQPKIKEPEKDGEAEAYRPKVKTWGVFPRPSNISKTYGGGKVIRPGDELETKEAKEAKEKRSRELIAAYRSKAGLDVDPKLIAECQKSLREGNDLMDRGRLKQALPFYENVMKDMIFESELHGRAALKWAICLDSLQRSSEAKVMYEKLKNHPNSEVNTTARHFYDSFKAMEFMKVKSTYLSRTTGYETYFDSFVDNKEVILSVKAEPEEARDTPILPYIVFLVSPLLVVLYIAVRKSFML